MRVIQWLLLCYIGIGSINKPIYGQGAVYQVYPRSFYDSNGDGIGDIRGIIEKLDYLDSLGVETLWLSPVFAHGEQDGGYDITQYDSVATEFGTKADLEELFAAAHQRKMKIWLDLVLNHTSQAHPWFQEARSSRAIARRNWYVWKDGKKKNRLPPNNWKNMLGKNGWQYDKQAQAWYWTSFLPFQPDLNYRNPAVQKSMLYYARYWFNLGADGFRLDIFNAIYEANTIRDQPFSIRPFPSDENINGFFQKPIYTLNQPESFLFAQQLRRLCNDFNPPRTLLGEVFGPWKDLRQFVGEKNDGLNYVFAFQTMNLKANAKQLREIVHLQEHYFAIPATPVYVFSNHDKIRAFNRWGENKDIARLMAVFQLTVRGLPVIYYGDEIGMSGTRLDFSTARDPIAKFQKSNAFIRKQLSKRGITLNREESRAPMQWTPQGGFSRIRQTWLPYNHKVGEQNVQAQTQDPNSILNTYKALLNLRKQMPALHAGTLKLSHISLPKNVFAYTRQHGKQNLLIVLNCSPRKTKVKLPNIEILYSTHPENGTNKKEKYLAPYQALVGVLK